MIKIIIALAAFVLVIYLLARPIEQAEKAKKLKLIEQRFGSRAPLTPEAFFEQHFSESPYCKDIVVGVRETLELILQSDLSFLRDSDDFSKNLAFFWDFDSMANVELVQALEDRFNIRIEDSEAERTKTVRQLVDLVHAKTGTAT